MYEEAEAWRAGVTFPVWWMVVAEQILESRSLDSQISALPSRGPTQGLSPPAPSICHLDVSR